MIYGNVLAPETFKKNREFPLVWKISGKVRISILHVPRKGISPQTEVNYSQVNNLGYF